MNEATDMEMTDVDASNASPPPPPTPPAAAAPNDVVGNLLALARQLIDQGKPSQALQAVSAASPSASSACCCCSDEAFSTTCCCSQPPSPFLLVADAPRRFLQPLAAAPSLHQLLIPLAATPRRLLQPLGAAPRPRSIPEFGFHPILVCNRATNQEVVMAMKAKGGEQAVFYILQRARELYVSKLQTSSEADQLASLFAECAIAEAQPVRSEPTPSPSPQPSLSMPATQTMSPANAIDSAAYEKSILAETGRKQIMLDAFSDGSSFICLQCGGLVSNDRKDRHYAYWCQF